MALPNFPINPMDLNPPIPLPFWANSSSALKIDPGNTKRETGYVYDLSGFGEEPIIETVNYNYYLIGLWSDYFNKVSLYFKSLINQNYLNSFFIECLLSKDEISTTPLVNKQIIFDRITYNNSGIFPYNSGSGIFTVPKTDMYLFSLLLIESCDHQASGGSSPKIKSFITLNGESLGSPNYLLYEGTKQYTTNSPVEYQSTSFSTPLYLTQNQRYSFQYTSVVVEIPGSVSATFRQKANSKLIISWNF